MKILDAIILDAIILGASMVAVSCGEPPPPPRSPAAELAVGGLRTTCPLGVKNAHVTFDETATGAALTFTTTHEHVEELRRRARDASAMHGSGQRLGEGHHGKHGAGGRKHGLNPVNLPPAQAGVEETRQGATVTFTPANPKDLDALRAHLKIRTENMMTSCE